MPRTSTRTERERARQARARAEEQRAALARRQRRTLALVALVLLLALLAGTAGALFGDRGSSRTAATASTSTTASTTTVPATGSAELTFPAPGTAMSGPTPCPAEDGSSPKVTRFEGPPPRCIDPTRFYEAVLHTTVGDLKLLLNPEQAPNAVNNFVVLARYHYYDGQPFTTILPRKAAQIRPRFEPPETDSPGYTLPGEAPERGQIFVPGTIAFVPATPDTDDYAASFVLATFELAADLPQNFTSFGLMLDGQQTLIAIDRSGSEAGSPTRAVVIDSITITPSSPIN
jgi:peptidyl-prolyl cis-trans isomerase B (cyclophilin B)